MHFHNRGAAHDHSPCQFKKFMNLQEIRTLHHVKSF